LLAKLERDWSAKGLALVRITDEPPEPVNRFLKRTHQSFSTLVNGKAAKEKYSVPAIPTLVVVDQSGKIIAYDVSELSETALLERLKRAGLK
jgi:hypothetical protein